MKNPKDKERRISNLKNMINNVKNDDFKEDNTIEDVDYDDYDYEIEEDEDLIDYFKEDEVEFEDLEIDDEYIYRPGENDDSAVNLEDETIDENFIIKTNMDENPSEETPTETSESEEFSDFSDEIESFDNFVHSKIGRTPVLAIISTLLGLVLIVISAILFNSISDRVIDNVVSGETTGLVVILLIFGLLLLIYGIYNVFGMKNPFENISSSINSIDKNEDKKPEPSSENTEKIIPKSNIPLDKEAYKIGEFNFSDLKNRLKKSTTSKKSSVEEDLDKIPPAKEKSDDKKGLTPEEIEEMEYEQAKLENESIDDIFAGVEDIDEMPIIGVDSKDDKKEQ